MRDERRGERDAPEDRRAEAQGDENPLVSSPATRMISQVKGMRATRAMSSVCGERCSRTRSGDEPKSFSPAIVATPASSTGAASTTTTHTRRLSAVRDDC